MLVEQARKPIFINLTLLFVDGKLKHWENLDDFMLILIN